MSSKHCNDGLDNRCRDGNGEIRRKRSDTLVGTLRVDYGETFAEEFRSDAKLGTVLRETKSNSLNPLESMSMRSSCCPAIGMGCRTSPSVFA